MTTSYKYNENGLRTSKTVNGATTEYLWAGGMLLQQSGNGKTLNFQYSGSQAVGVQHNGTNYYYLRNLQGDVIAIYNADGNIVAKYTYDTWGAMVAITDAEGEAITDQNHIANVNPIRYRGYYYDTETKLYYLQTRYYNPEWCRFLNADCLFIAGEELKGSNMYAYCGNNPVMGYDPSGMLDDDMTFGQSFAQALRILGYASIIANAGININAIQGLTVDEAITLAMNLSKIVGGNVDTLSVNVLDKLVFKDYGYHILLYSDGDISYTFKYKEEYKAFTVKAGKEIPKLFDYFVDTLNMASNYYDRYKSAFVYNTLGILPSLLGAKVPSETNTMNRYYKLYNDAMLNMKYIWEKISGFNY